jgi:hypothetical protein
MAVMLFTGSNFTNILLLTCFAVLFIFKSSRDQKSLIALCMMFLVVFMVKISPQNYLYVQETVKNTLRIKTAHSTSLIKPRLYLPITLMPDSLLTADEKKEKIARRYMDSVYVVNHPVRHSEAVLSVTSISHNKITASTSAHAIKLPPPPPILKTEGGRPLVSTPDINTKPYQHIVDTSDYQKSLLAFIGTHKTSLPLSAQNNYKTPLPGKVISWLQTLNFFVSHPFRIITGDGIGNFSSKLAFKASGLGFAGGYPQKYIYLDPDFLSNHLDVYLNFFSKKTDFHSLSNNPDSVYDQLFAEYGLVGLIAFMVWYLGYFLKHYKKLTYGLPILLMVLALFFIEYWFEQLSILVFFELLLLLNIKETSSKTILAHAH